MAVCGCAVVCLVDCVSLVSFVCVWCVCTAYCGCC